MENGDVHAVVGSPSIAWAPVDCGSPVSRRFDVAVATPASRLSTSSAARSLRRSVIRVEKSRSEPSGELADDLRLGIAAPPVERDRCAGGSDTIASGVVAATFGRVGRQGDNLGVRAEAELGEPDRRRSGIGRTGRGRRRR